MLIRGHLYPLEDIYDPQRTPISLRGYLISSDDTYFFQRIFMLLRGHLYISEDIYAPQRKPISLRGYLCSSEDTCIPQRISILHRGQTVTRRLHPSGRLKSIFSWVRCPIPTW
jgi:hypothetical protein